MAEKFNPYLLHEALDRAHLATEFVDDHLLDHPAVQEFDEAKGLAIEAHDALARLYQVLGGLRLKQSEEQS